MRVNNRKVLNGVLEVAGLEGTEKENERGIVLRAIDKLDRLGPEGVRALLGEGRQDESGDFTKGAGLNAEQTEIVMGFANATAQIVQNLEKSADASTGLGVDMYKDASRKPIEGSFNPAGNELDALEYNVWNAAVVDHLKKLVVDSSVGREGVQELEAITSLLAAQGYFADRIRLDPSVVRGLGYYTGPVYEAELTFEILDEKGRKRQFGSVAGGGRYDDLVKRFTGQAVPATGVSIGVDRLLAALREKGRIGSSAEGPVVVTVMDRDRMADYQAMVAELRQAGIRAEVYLGNPKNFGNQLKYADRRNSPVAVIEGGDEKAKGHRPDQGSDPWREDCRKRDA